MHQRTLFLIAAAAIIAAPQFALADGDGAVTGVVGGAVAGAVVGSLVGAVVGGVAGGVIETEFRDQGRSSCSRCRRAARAPRKGLAAMAPVVRHRPRTVRIRVKP